jgi:uncharacterized protein with FMN-binding domain
MATEPPKRSDAHDAPPPAGRRHAALLTLGSATVLSIYSAGFLRTRAAANRVAAESDLRRPASVGAPLHIAVFPSAQPNVPLMPPAPIDSSKLRPAPARAVKSGPVPTPRAVGDVAAAPADTGTRMAPVVVAVQPPIPVAPSSPAPAVDTAKVAADTVRVGYKDGTYSGWGTSRHGDIEATVEVKNGRIMSAEISQCRTRYSCARIADLPPQVLSRQSPEVDYVSGATQSSNAYYYAVVEALKKAK